MREWGTLRVCCVTSAHIREGCYGQPGVPMRRRGTWGLPDCPHCAKGQAGRAPGRFLLGAGPCSSRPTKRCLGHVAQLPIYTQLGQASPPQSHPPKQPPPSRSQPPPCRPLRPPCRPQPPPCRPLPTKGAHLLHRRTSSHAPTHTHARKPAQPASTGPHLAQAGLHAFQAAGKLLSWHQALRTPPRAQPLELRQLLLQGRHACGGCRRWAGHACGGASQCRCAVSSVAVHRGLRQTHTEGALRIQAQPTPHSWKV